MISHASSSIAMRVPAEWLAEHVKTVEVVVVPHAVEPEIVGVPPKTLEDVVREGRGDLGGAQHGDDAIKRAMSVRAWFAISAVVLVVLAAAVAYRFVAPLPAPAIVARVGSIELRGVDIESCWPRRSGRIHCTSGDKSRPKAVSVPSSGTIRIVAAFPVQPPDGRVTIGTAARVVSATKTWTPNLAYRLASGTYSVHVQAFYPHGARLDYLFALRAR
jgi:hypothetical protein